MSDRTNLLLPNQSRWLSDEPIIELENVCKAFDGKPVIEGLSLAIKAGETTVISGQSGTGKSVLLKMMNGLVVPDKGEVRLFGQNLSLINITSNSKLLS